MDNNQGNQQPVTQQNGQSIYEQPQNYQQSYDSQINGSAQNNQMNNTQPYQPNYNQQGYNQQPIYQTYSQQAYNQQQVNQTYSQQPYNQQQVNQTYGQQANIHQVNQTYGQQVYNQQQVNQTYGQQIYNQPPYQNYNQPYPQQPVQSGKANAALVCGILSILISPLCLIFAIISIVNAVGSKKQTGGKMVGKAVAGVVCSVISLVVGFLVTALLCGILAPSLIGYTNKASISNDYQVCQSVSTALITAAMDPEVLNSPDFTLPADGDYELDEFLDDTGSAYKDAVYDILGISSSTELSSQLKAKGHNGSNEDNGFRVIVEDSQGYVDFIVYIPNSCDQGAANCSNCEPISSY